MKIFLFIICSIPFLAFSQNLTLREIIELQEIKHEKIKESLISRNWVIIQEMGGEEFPFGDVRFAFDDESGNCSNSFFIALQYYKENIQRNRIGFEIPTHEQYLKYVEELLQLGFERNNVSQNINESWEIYQNNKFYIEAVVRPVDDYFGSPRTFYDIIITHLEDPHPSRHK
jgi:hypothetical protein